MALTETAINVVYKIKAVKLTGQLKERLMSLGFNENSAIKLIRIGPKRNLRVFVIKGVMYALRKEETDLIEVERWD